MRYFLATVLSFSTVLALTACDSKWSAQAAETKPAAITEVEQNRSILKDIQSLSGKRISIMAYNVENLFDTEHDEGKEDWTSLPLSFKQANPELMQKECAKMTTPHFQQECMSEDWSNEVLDIKMQRLADTILQVGNGRGPDILIVEEVENIRVLKQLNSKYLTAAGYQTVVLKEGEDERGIDVGILSRFPLAEPEQLHLIEFTPDASNPKWERPTTRGIMEAALKLPNGETLYVLGFHFPSQANPVQHRIDAVNTLIKIKNSKGPNALVVTAGDSNITAIEDQKVGLISKTLAAEFSVSSLVGCKDCKGTHFYKGEWNFLDLMMFSSRFSEADSNVSLLPERITVPNQGRFQLTKNGTPARFDDKSSVGVSDHLPIYGELVFK